VCVCVCVCARARMAEIMRVRAGVSVCVCEWVGVDARARACPSLRTYFAKRRRHIVFRVLSGSLRFLTLSHKRQDFRKKVTEHKIYVLIFSKTFI
jgi:hypothetical protein